MDETYTTYGTLASNDQLAPVYERGGLYAPRFARQSIVVGQGRGAGYSLPGAGGYDMPGLSGYGAGSSGNGTGGSGGAANMDAAAAAASDPFNPSVSPVWWAVLFFVVGMLGLRYVHWRG